MSHRSGWWWWGGGHVSTLRYGCVHTRVWCYYNVVSSSTFNYFNYLIQIMKITYILNDFYNQRQGHLSAFIVNVASSTGKCGVMLRFCGALLLAGAALSFAVHDEGGNRRIGRVKSRSSSEIKKSMWSIGTETQDRNYTIYSKYEKYIAPLGAKRARLQAGWGP